jgi:hypothetical protein
MESAVPLTLKVLLWLSELDGARFNKLSYLIGVGPQDQRQLFRSANYRATSGMPSRCFPKPWTVQPMPSEYRVIDANGIVLAHVYGQPDGAIAQQDRSPVKAR